MSPPASGGAMSRRDVLRVSAAGVGTLAAGRQTTVVGRGQSGSVGPGDLPPLRKAFFLVRDDGDIDWGLLFDGTITDVQDDIAGRKLFRFPAGDARPRDVSVTREPVRWGERHTTDESAHSFAQSIGHAEKGDRLATVAGGSATGGAGDTTLDFADRGNPDTFAEKRAVTGTITNAMSTTLDATGAGEMVRVPAIDYAGRYATPAGAGPLPPAGTAKVQLFDGYTHSLPSVGLTGRSDLVTAYTDLYDGYPRPFLDTNLLVPSFEHLNHPALPVLQSHALMRAKFLGSLHQLATDETTDGAQDIQARAIGQITSSLGNVGPGTPTWDNLGSVVVWGLSNIVIPFGAIALVVLSGPGAVVGAAWLAIAEGLALAVDLGWLVWNYAGGLGNVKWGTARSELEEVRTDAVLGPVVQQGGKVDATEGGPTALETALLAELQGGAATQRLALGGGAAAFRDYIRLLDVQQAIARRYNAMFGAEEYDVAPPNLKDAILNIDSAFGGMVDAIATEKELLQNLNLSQMDVSFADRPEETLLGQDPTGRFEAAVDRQPPLGSVGGYEWRFRPRPDGSTQAPPAEVVTTAAPRLDHEFTTAGTYDVQVRPTVSNELTNGPSTGPGAATRVSVAAPVDPTIAVPDANPDRLPPETDVTFSARGSTTALGETIESYEWFVTTERDDAGRFERETDRPGDGPEATGIEVDLSFPSSDTYTVVLVATDSRGETAVAQSTVYVYDDSSVVAQFDTTPDPPVTAGRSITFDAAPSRTPLEGEIDAYDWSILRLPSLEQVADGTGPTMTHAFESAGDYQVVLEIRDGTDAARTLTAIEKRGVAVRPGEPDEEADETPPDDAEPDDGPPEDERPDADLDDEDIRFRYSTPSDQYRPRAGEPVTVSLAPVGKPIEETEWRFEPADQVTLPVEPDTRTVNQNGLVYKFPAPGVWRVRVTVHTPEGTVTDADTVPVTGVAFAEMTDPDGDGLYEDLNGNGRMDFDDVAELRANRETEAIRSNHEKFDFAGDGNRFDEPTAADVRALFEEIRDRIGGE